MPGHLLRIAKWQMGTARGGGRLCRQWPVSDTEQPPSLRMQPRGLKPLKKDVHSLTLDHLADEEDRGGPQGSRCGRMKQQGIGAIQAFTDLPAGHPKKPHQAEGVLAGHEKAVIPATQAEPKTDRAEQLPERMPATVVGHAHDRTALRFRLCRKPLAQRKSPAGGEHDVGYSGGNISP